MKRALLVAALAIQLVWSPLLALADDSNGAVDLKQEVDQLNAQVKERESRINDLNGSIDKYKEKIAQQEAAVSSLQNEAALLDNRIQEHQLATERTRQQIELASLQIEQLKVEIAAEQSRIDKRLQSLAELVRQMNEADGVSVMDEFLARPSLSEFFAQVGQLQRVQQDLGQATHDLKESKANLEGQQKNLEDQVLALQTKKDELQKEEDALNQEKAAKQSFIAETQSSEQEFQRVLYELRQEQQSTADSLSALQDKLKDKLDSVDAALARGDVLLNWPIRPAKGISAFFHDPTYPFRNLFEHPGIDMPTDVGTPVRAAAGGYVAWNKTGRQYGNYVMLIHPGGIATVYAHLTRFVAKPDTYVERGDIIGYSGGQPGMAGAGLSTGPHLHFEVRQNGIPTNPLNFLPSLN